MKNVYADSNEGSQSLNSEITNFIHLTASDCLTLTNMHHLPPNISTRTLGSLEKHEMLKEQLRKASSIVSDFPSSDFLRKKYYQIKKEYKSLCSRQKNEFFAKINIEIESGKIFNWKQFKKTQKS